LRIYPHSAFLQNSRCDHLGGVVGVVSAATLSHYATGLRNCRPENSRVIRPNDLRENFSARAAENDAAEILETFPSVSAVYRKHKKLLLYKHLRVAEQEIFELTVRFQQIAL
jgi:hypothetical protein